MPAVRSFFTLSVLAACLAQASAGSNMGPPSGDSSWGNEGSAGYGGGQGGSWGGGNGGGNGYNNQYTSTWGAAPTNVVQAQSCPPMSCPPPMTSTMTETTTVTAVSPCTGSTVTAYVTQWMNAPPGCWCGAGGPPSGMEWGGMGDAAVFTSTNPSFTPGLSSIPASEAVQTGVTVAGAPPAAAPTGTVSPGGFFGESSSSAMTTSARSFELDYQHKLIVSSDTFINLDNFYYYNHEILFIIVINIIIIVIINDNIDNLLFKQIRRICGGRLSDKRRVFDRLIRYHRPCNPHAQERLDVRHWKKSTCTDYVIIDSQKETQKPQQ
ncbi:hypothetical protein AYL99_02510 [Fonsecaea erecta]|uniref:Uncharacterized protein n=1 Tax=Fonsecaea erecta TaxID=1367422 RepID=A0A178ZVL0_9EURO|nr:hypothetical protein AYL99_02510 [Fonsecaea erecta]OAP63283.1 hypothetical protein AYL99_02510 [Fonsecaea erecta]